MDIKHSEDELSAARTDVYLHLKKTSNIIYHFGSLVNGIEELNLNDFIENQVQVIASSRALAREADRRLQCSIELNANMNDIIDAVHKTFGVTPVVCDGSMIIPAESYNELAKAINKLAIYIRK